MLGPTIILQKISLFTLSNQHITYSRKMTREVHPMHAWGAGCTREIQGWRVRCISNASDAGIWRGIPRQIQASHALLRVRYRHLTWDPTSDTGIWRGMPRWWNATAKKQPILNFNLEKSTTGLLYSRLWIFPQKCQRTIRFYFELCCLSKHPLGR